MFTIIFIISMFVLKSIFFFIKSLILKSVFFFITAKKKKLISNICEIILYFVIYIYLYKKLSNSLGFVGVILCMCIFQVLLIIIRSLFFKFFLVKNIDITKYKKYNINSFNYELMLYFLYFVTDYLLVIILISILIIFLNLMKLIYTMNKDFNNVMYNCYYNNYIILTAKGKTKIKLYVCSLVLNSYDIVFLNREDFFVLEFLMQKHPSKKFFYLIPNIDFIDKK